MMTVIAKIEKVFLTDKDYLCRDLHLFFMVLPKSTITVTLDFPRYIYGTHW